MRPARILTALAALTLAGCDGENRYHPGEDQSGQVRPRTPNSFTDDTGWPIPHTPDQDVPLYRGGTQNDFGEAP